VLPTNIPATDVNRISRNISCVDIIFNHRFWFGGACQAQSIRTSARKSAIS
jgi:hypothetical protein